MASEHDEPIIFPADDDNGPQPDNADKHDHKSSSINSCTSIYDSIGNLLSRNNGLKEVFVYDVG